MSDPDFTNSFFLFKLNFIEMLDDYTNAIVEVRKNRKLIFKDTYFLTCELSDDDIISLILTNYFECKEKLSIDTDELIRLLDVNEYDKRNRCFKTEEQAKNVADYINSALILRTLKM